MNDWRHDWKARALIYPCKHACRTAKFVEHWPMAYYLRYIRFVGVQPFDVQHRDCRTCSSAPTIFKGLGVPTPEIKLPTVRKDAYTVRVDQKVGV